MGENSNKSVKLPVLVQTLETVFSPYEFLDTLRDRYCNWMDKRTNDRVSC